VDAVHRAYLLRALTWGGLPGFIIGGIAGAYVTRGMGLPALLIGVGLGGLLAGAVVVGVGVIFSEGGGAAARILLGTTGHAPARRKEYSFAASLAARGLFDKAIEAYEKAVLDDPLDSEPYLRIGRLYRDELDRPDDAVLWFKQARREAALSPAQDLFISGELVELYRNRMGKPEKALPELARLAEMHPGTPEEEWAKSELRRLKSERSERGRGPVSEPEA